MKLEQQGGYFIGRLEQIILSEKERNRLIAMANEETAEEFVEMLDEAQALAAPEMLFTVSTVTDVADETVCVNGVKIASALVAQKLGQRKRCFPYIATCGRALEEWSLQYAGDFLAEFWADEIKKSFLKQMLSAGLAYIKETYHITGHLPALNPGSLKEWPITGQQELFAILGGRDAVQERIGVRYTDSFLMLPSKSVSGIAFESEAFYENCQHCPLINCPGRRAPHLEHE